MNKLLVFIIVVALTACSSAAAPLPESGVTEWGTPYVVNRAVVAATYKAELACIQRLLATNRWDRNALKRHLSDCDWDAYQARTFGEPKTYYFWDGQQERGQSPFAEFDMCISGVASYSWDFPDEYTTDDFRSLIVKCIDMYPKL
jgi:hypothetical protein